MVELDNKFAAKNVANTTVQASPGQVHPEDETAPNDPSDPGQPIGETHSAEDQGTLSTNTVHLRTVGTQITPQYSAHEVDTSMETIVRMNAKKCSGIAHAHGCWPADVDPTDAEAVKRWRKKIERDESYIATVLKLGSMVEGVIKENNALDLYTHHFANASANASASPWIDPPELTHVHSINSGPEQGSVTSLCWAPEGKELLAVATSDSVLRIYDVLISATNLSQTHSTFHAPEDSVVTVQAYKPTNSNTLAAGLENGHCCLFDCRSQEPWLVNFLAHRDRVTGISWCAGSKGGMELMTTSTDGWATWWDVRLPGTKVDSLPLSYAPSSMLDNGTNTRYSATCLMNYTGTESAAGPTQFWVGSSCGDILVGDRGGLPTFKSAKLRSAPLSGHHSGEAIHCMHRNCAGSCISLSSSRINVWSASDSPMLRLAPWRQSSTFRAGAWSPSREGMLYVGDSMGNVDAWDVTNLTDPGVLKPIATLGPAVTKQSTEVTGLEITSASESHATLIAVAYSDGRVSIIQPSAGLCEAPCEAVLGSW